jgi:hypothetical protein
VIALDPGTITMIQGVGFLDSGIRFVSCNGGGRKRMERPRGGGIDTAGAVPHVG